MLRESDLADWHQMEGLLEVSRTKEPAARIICTCISKAFCMFNAQPSRHFIVTLFMVDTEWGVTYFDRSGEVFVTFDYSNHADFVLTIAALMFGADEVLGYDPDVTRRGGREESVRVKAELYTINKVLFASTVLRGRATVCWLVSKGGIQYVIKNTSDDGRQYVESEFLEECQKHNIEGVPWIVAIAEMNHKTLSRPCNVKGVETRTYRCFVMGPVCEPLTAFSSRTELLQAFIDIIQSMQDLSVLIHSNSNTYLSTREAR